MTAPSHSGLLDCIGHGGEKNQYRFEWIEDETDKGVWHFTVYPLSSSPSPHERFSLRLDPLDGSLFIQVITGGEQPWAVGKGIGSALIRKASTITGKRIFSDPEHTEDAERMWQKMKERHEAVQRYEFIASRPSPP
jgi:hypothetical protein